VTDNVQEEEVLGKAYDSRLMKRLLAYLKPYKLFVGLAVFILLIASLIQLAGPFLYKIGIDNYIEKGDSDGLLSICLIFVGILILEFIIQFAETYLIHWIGQKAMYDMRSEIFSHLQKLPVQFFDRNPVGRLVTRVTTDVQSLNEMLSSGAVAIFWRYFQTDRHRHFAFAFQLETGFGDFFSSAVHFLFNVSIQKIGT